MPSKVWDENSIPSWICNHMPSKVWDEITFPIPNHCPIEIDSRNAQNVTFHTYSTRCSGDIWMHLRSYRQANLNRNIVMAQPSILGWTGGQIGGCEDRQTNISQITKFMGPTWALLAPDGPHETRYQGYSIAPALHCSKASSFVIVYTTVYEQDRRWTPINPRPP